MGGTPPHTLTLRGDGHTDTYPAAWPGHPPAPRLLGRAGRPGPRGLTSKRLLVTPFISLRMAGPGGAEEEEGGGRRKVSGGSRAGGAGAPRPPPAAASPPASTSTQNKNTPPASNAHAHWPAPGTARRRRRRQRRGGGGTRRALRRGRPRGRSVGENRTGEGAGGNIPGLRAPPPPPPTPQAAAPIAPPPPASSRPPPPVRPGGAARAPPAPRQPGAAGLPPSGISGGRDDPPPDNGGPGRGEGGGRPQALRSFPGGAGRWPELSQSRPALAWRHGDVIPAGKSSVAEEDRRLPARPAPPRAAPSQRAETTMYQRGLFACK